MLRHRIKEGDVLLMLSLMLLEYKVEGISIRNDNGLQFIAMAVRQYLKDKGGLPGVLACSNTAGQCLHRSTPLKRSA